MEDLKGKTMMVTGANTGIGKQTALGLAVRGARVVLTARTVEKAQPALAEIKAACGHDRLHVLALELGDFAKVRESAKEFLSWDMPLHVLINNAGLAGQKGITTDGFELAFGVNHLGTFLFTNLIVDSLKEQTPSRIVTVASQAHYGAKEFPWDGLQSKTKTTTGYPEYQVSKLANVLFASHLHKLLEGSGVTSCSLHPGVIASEIWRKIPWPIRPIMNLFMKSTKDGAKCSVYCAADLPDSELAGAFFDDLKPRRPSRLARDCDLAEKLWEKSAAWTGLK